MTPDQLYKDHHKLIYKLAWSANVNTGIDLEELISEFNVVFCEALEFYAPDKNIKFSTYLYKCITHRVRNLLTKLGRKKRILITQGYHRKGGEDLVWSVLDRTGSYDPMDSIILYDNFVNNENPVIRSVAKIVSTYQIPRTDFRRWLKGVLLSQGFNKVDIAKAFKILKTIYDPAAI